MGSAGVVSRGCRDRVDFSYIGLRWTDPSLRGHRTCMRSVMHPVPGRVRAWTTALAAIATIAAASGCLRRDVAAEEPTTKIVFSTEVPQPAIDKVDVLVMVDNSSSMADKQKILGDAVPDLVRGLVQPRCVDKATKTPLSPTVLADPLRPEKEQCPAGAEPAWKPITDMHVGVISSSMGAFGGDECKPDPARHNDDHGHLLARGANGPIAEAGDLHFLAWYPDVEANHDKDRHPEPPVPKLGTLDAFGDAFTRLVVGVGQDGCGLEAQLESVYHFLVQPDPWNAITVDGHRASYGPKNDVDGELLRQRAAFLRPDSLVAIIVLTDEDDSSVDPLTLDATGFVFENQDPLPRATSACDLDPTSRGCTTCYGGNSDPACSANNGYYTAAQDSPNVRFQHMKKRFGIDPQFPIARYVDALTKAKVPQRDDEHDAHGSYVGKATCTNPLFAARLPSTPGENLCDLPRGSRTKDLVYFAIIGGVPNQLLPARTSDPIDWTKVLGKDPARYDETGIDPHMIASTDPRPGLPLPSAADDADPASGREWTTGGTDLQYACIFDLPAPNDCTGSDSCDCDGKKDVPLCQSRLSTIQTKGKAYPTRRELMVAKELGDHAVVASLCAKEVKNAQADDYGYRPAVRAIADRLGDNLAHTCLPRPLEADGSGDVACLVLAILPEGKTDADCKALYGLDLPPASVVTQLRDRLAADEGEGARKLGVCAIPQLAVPTGSSCNDEEDQTGFCYVSGAPGKCEYQLAFTKPTARLTGARFTMQCLSLATP